MYGDVDRESTAIEARSDVLEGEAYSAASNIWHLPLVLL